MYIRENIGGSTGTVAEQKPGQFAELLMNNGWNCLWRGHPVQPTDHLMPSPFWPWDGNRKVWPSESPPCAGPKWWDFKGICFAVLCSPDAVADKTQPHMDQGLRQADGCIWMMTRSLLMLRQWNELPKIAACA